MTSFQAVILGGDLGAYALARELNDAYGTIPTMVTAFDPAAIRDSRILRRHGFEHASQERPLVDELLRIGRDLRASHPDEPVLLLANTDWRIHVLAAHRRELERHFLLPIPPVDVIEQVSDKQTFERLATAQGMPVPRSFYVDFSSAGSGDWTPAPLPDDFPFPVVAKPADSSQYENLVFPGRQKVYRIDDRSALDDLWHRLSEAGFRGVFVVQELIGGDDTGMYSATAYVDSTGAVSLLCSAHVLLEEHHPATLGNPCAMITEAHEEILTPVRRFLESLPYRGFANFDVKRDPRTGRFLFLEVNPRIGRNSFYVAAAGVNPMEALVSDVVEGRPLPPAIARGEALYSIIPDRLLRRYVTDPALAKQVRRLQRAGRVSPQRNPRDMSPRRRLRLLESELNQYRKFNRYYPRPTDTGF
ncbi:hypothetical protein [uncultured Bifidobacterium sp.]|uniref:carboxylate--amine ligase n=1 Tax=uncultured Bifidobacterium sp. TaxID=165187 RepID=UPI0028DC2580|nr:hypothetical protein [uncultured Bifidobacterium sp.]